MTQMMEYRTEKGQMPDKATDPMGWVQAVNNIKQTATEIAIKELIEDGI